MAITLVTGADMMSQMNGMMGGDARRSMLGFFVVWVVLIVVAVVAVPALVIRRAARS